MCFWISVCKWKLCRVNILDGCLPSKHNKTRRQLVHWYLIRILKQISVERSEPYMVFPYWWFDVSAWMPSEFFTIKVHFSPIGVARLVVAVSSPPEGCGFSPQSDHIPKVTGSTPQLEYAQEASDQCFSLMWIFLFFSLALTLSCSLSPHPLKIYKHILGWGFLKN